MLQYIHKIICPYVTQKRVQLKLGVDFPALILFDHFSGQITQKVFDLQEKININFVLIPKTCMDRLQPMDLSVNKPFKAHLKQSFHTWYTSQIKKEIEENEDSSLSPVDLCRAPTFRLKNLEYSFPIKKVSFAPCINNLKNSLRGPPISTALSNKKVTYECIYVQKLHETMHTFRTFLGENFIFFHSFIASFTIWLRLTSISFASSTPSKTCNSKLFTHHAIVISLLHLFDFIRIKIGISCTLKSFHFPFAHFPPKHSEVHMDQLQFHFLV